jgi:hypothetical protein
LASKPFSTKIDSESSAFSLGTVGEQLDNMPVVITMNKKSSKSPRVMTLVRKLVLACLDYNILLKAEHISGHLNCSADSLSRSNFQKFQDFVCAMMKTVHFMYMTQSRNVGRNSGRRMTFI